MSSSQEVMLTGARVHYVRDSSGGSDYPRVCRAAIVTGFPPAELGFAVDLTVFDAEGFRNKRAVAYDDGKAPAGGTWHRPDPLSPQCQRGTWADRP
jgi:hypothetical protein